MSVALLVDFKLRSDWPFLRRFASKHKVDCVSKVSNTPDFHTTRFGVLRRYYRYFIFPLKLVLKHPADWDCIVGWQQFHGLNYALWSSLLHRPKKERLIVMTFIYNPKHGLVGKIYHRYVKFCLSSGYVDRVVCFSSQECRTYAKQFGLPESLFTSLELGIDATEGADIVPHKGTYVFSTGRSNRDYDFLVESLGDSYNLRIACPEYTPAVQGGSHTLEVLDNCFGDAMLREMADSLCVVIPLRDTAVSSGQLVVLQAMRMGKPVIVTENDTMPTYIDHGTTGFIVHKDKRQLLDTIRLLDSDKELYERISRNQRAAFTARFTEEALADRLSQVIDSL